MTSTDEVPTQNNNHRKGILQHLWIKTCRLIVLAFYRRVEISGDEILQQYGPVVLCANHNNALADAVLLQISTPRLLHPVARSGLFKNPFLKIILYIWQAIPVYRQQDRQQDRRQDGDNPTVSNQQMFSRVYDMLLGNQVVMLFPEGQSHSDASLREIKTGAARITLGCKEQYGFMPVVIPVGLNFTNKGKFRSSVYINYGEPLHIDDSLNINKDTDVRFLTKQIAQGMKDVTLNVEQAEDLVFVKQLERFIAFRKTKYRRRNLQQKFKAFKTLIRYQKRLRKHSPKLIEDLQSNLKQFYRLCNRLGIEDYQLSIRYDSRLITRFIIRTLVVLIIIMPMAILGTANSIIPYVLTGRLATWVSKDTDQHDASKILIGAFLFSIFWGVTGYQLYQIYGPVFSTIYAVLLLPTTAAALYYRREKRLIRDNIKVFFMFMRQHRLRRYLIKKRKRIEMELANLIKQAAKLKQTTSY